ncbi:hypothetical protein V6N13_072137 [Hibiscus sabdariffa]
MEETKVFHTSLINFLCFQFSNIAAFFAAQPTTTHQANFSAATQPKSTIKPSEGAGNTEKVNLSSDDENEIFDWHTPMEHHRQICPTPRAADILDSSTAEKFKEPAPAEGEALPVATSRRSRKTRAGRIMLSDRSSSLDKEEQAPPRPAKRQRRYHVITIDSDDDSSTELPVENPEQPADPSLSHTF